MRKQIVFFVFLFFFKNASSITSNHPIPIQELPVYEAKIKSRHWFEECNAVIKQLVYITVPFWGFDQQAHTGALIVHQQVADELIEIFKILFENKFPIQSIKTIDEFKNEDNLSMEANNTSAFNCRKKSTRPNELSNHAYGIAIDINPQQNPFVEGEIVLPNNGLPYVDRSTQMAGMITRENLIYKLFIKRGWQWGGDWNDLKDYQHFEKKIMTPT